MTWVQNKLGTTKYWLKLISLKTFLTFENQFTKTIEPSKTKLVSNCSKYIVNFINERCKYYQSEVGLKSRVLLFFKVFYF